MGKRSRRTDRVPEGEVMQGFPVPLSKRVTLENAYARPYTRWFMQHVREVERTASVGCGGHDVAPLLNDTHDLDDWCPTGDGGPTLTDILRVTHTDGFLVLLRGAVICEKYFNGMTADTPHIWHSVSKSLASCVAGNLVERGLLDPDEAIITYVPELAGSAYDGALVRHLLDMQVGIAYSEDYEDPDSDVNALDRLYGVRPSRSLGEPGSSYDYATGTAPKGNHGEEFSYVSLNVNVLGWVMERTTGISMPKLIRREIWDALGTEHEAYIALDGAGSAQMEGGFCSSLRDLARLGQALCQQGSFNGHQIVPASWIDDAQRAGDQRLFEAHEEAHIMPGGSYRSNFWISRSPDHTALLGLGIYGQVLYVNQTAQVVAAKFSTQPTANDLSFFKLEFKTLERLAASLG